MSMWKPVAYFDAMDFDELLNDLASDDMELSLLNNSPSSTTCSDDSLTLSAENDVAIQDNNSKSPQAVGPYIPKPTILRSDIRRCYTEMFSNILNMADFPLMYGFLDTYFTPDFVEYSLNFNPITNEPYYDTFNGPTAVGKMFCTLFQMSPDAAFSFTDTKIHLSSDTTRCKIVCQFSMSATKVLDVPDDSSFEPSYDQCDSRGNIHQHPLQQEVATSAVCCSSKRKRREQQLNSARTAISDIQKSVNNATSAMTLTANPVRISMTSTMTMYVNEDKYIYKIVNDGVNQEQRLSMVKEEHCPFCSVKKLFKNSTEVGITPISEAQ